MRTRPLGALALVHLPCTTLRAHTVSAGRDHPKVHHARHCVILALWVLPMTTLGSGRVGLSAHCVASFVYTRHCHSHILVQLHTHALRALSLLSGLGLLQPPHPFNRTLSTVSPLGEYFAMPTHAKCARTRCAVHDAQAVCRVSALNITILDCNVDVCRNRVDGRPLFSWIHSSPYPSRQLWSRLKRCEFSIGKFKLPHAAKSLI